MSTKVTDSVAFSGGAEASLGFFKPIHEIDYTDVKFCGEFVAMVSGGVVMFVASLCGYSARQIASMLKSLGGDKYMKMKPKLWEIPKWLRAIRKSLNGKAVEIASQMFTWDRLLASERLAEGTKPLIGLCKYKDLVKAVGRDALNGLGDGHFTAPWKEIVNGNPGELLEKIGIYWFSYDGTYEYNRYTQKLEKVSDHVEKLSDLYMAAWSNVRLTGKTYKLDFGRRSKLTGRVIKERAFDLGIINNKANMIPPKVYSISCVNYPKSYVKRSGLVGIDAFTYLSKPAFKTATAKPTDFAQNIPFYDFSDDRVENEYKYGEEMWCENRYFS
jgi:hypothetical protein